MKKWQKQQVPTSPPAPSTALRSYLKDVNVCDALSEKQTRALFAQLRTAESDQERQRLLETITNAHLSYVVEVAKSFIDVELILVDYIQEGNISLIEAIHAYDQEGEESFLDFLTAKLYQDLQRYENENPLPKNIYPPIKTVSKKRNTKQS